MVTSFDLTRPIAIGCDHAGLDYKAPIVQYLNALGYQVKDFGTYEPGSVDFPDYAHPTALDVESGESAFGILICGSANGVAITANKHQGVRAAICWQTEIARLARQHNNANIICIPARFVSIEVAKEMVTLFIETKFEGGRHENRVKKISC